MKNSKNVQEWVIKQSETEADTKILILYEDVETPIASIKLDKELVNAIVETSGYKPKEKKPFWGVFFAIMLGGLILAISFLSTALSRFSF
jgi:hypothetical protein